MPPPGNGMPNLVATVNKSSNSKRPRTFGRTSNIWQYVEVVQERTTPVSKYRKSSAHSTLDEGDEDEENELEALSNDALHPNGTGDPRAGPNGRLEPMPGAPGVGTRTGANAGQSGPERRTSQVLKHVKSLPELHLPLPTNKKASNASIMGEAAAAVATSAPMISTSTIGRRAGPLNTVDVIKRIQALGTSASVPYLPSSSSQTAVAMAVNPSTAPTMPTGGNNQVVVPQATGPIGAPSSVSGSTTANATPFVAAAVAPLSEAERMRNDFNSQRGKLYFGCSVAFELFNGDLMMVRSPDGVVAVHSLEKMHLKSANNPSGKHRAVFTLINLTDVRSASSIRYGDAIWLQLSVGPGETSWESGGVLGAKVREAPQLKALALADDESIRNTALAPLIVGHPVPVRAYLPKNRDDVDAQVDEIQSRVRNKSSKMLGKWIIRSALHRKRKPSDNFVYNTDEIYLEQDWFYLGADSDAGVAVLRQLPTASSLKEVKLGDYVVERRAAWRIRLLDSSNGSTGLSLAQQQMEKLLLKAKTQLKQSRKMRAGQAKQYGQDIQGGSSFVTQWRSQLVATTRDCDTQYMAQQERRLSQLSQHFTDKAADAFTNEDDRFQYDKQQSSPASSARWPSAGSQRGDGATAKAMPESPEKDSATTTATGAAGSSSNNGHICSLCQSSSIGYNLCCQIHHVMNTLHTEIEQASAARSLAKVHAHSHAHRTNGGGAAATPGGTGGEGSRTAATSTPDKQPPPHANASPAQRRKSVFQRDSGSHGAAPTGISIAPTLPLASSSSTPLLYMAGLDRMTQLFAVQDQQLLDVIKYKENAAKAAIAAVEQARIGLSPVAAQFRDRFKHVTQFAQQHTHNVDGTGLVLSEEDGQQQQDDQQHHGIGGHFHKIHEEIKRKESQRRATYIRENRVNRAIKHLDQLREDGYDDDQDHRLEMVLDTTIQCPLEHPGPGFDVYGHRIMEEIHRERLFPNEDELEKLPPVDTKQALELYLQNKNAVMEMLDGFVDLVETHILPNLANAMGAKNRGALVEFLDFTARASEFVCARRVQVRVAMLLHVVSESQVGDFEKFDTQFQELLHEFDNTVAFIKFYRDKVGSKNKSKGKRKLVR